MMLRVMISLAQVLVLVSANDDVPTVSKARELRQRLTYTSDPTRRNQLRHRRAQLLGVSSIPSYSQIFGLSIKEFDQILTSDVAYEFGAHDADLGIDRALELWEDAANFQLDLAIEAEERWAAGDAEYGRGDAEYPYIICSKKPRKSALERKLQIVDIVVYGAEDEFYSVDDLFTIYNDKEMTCFGTRFLASTALTIADLQDSELPLLPIGAYLKIRAGTVAEALERAGIDTDLDVPIDEDIFL